ncbi:MAG: hypothetical protein OXF68_02005 [Gammaproteobacteria bacterium]|nr:hypothetical protein [Gammaproteobacteria bacterium]
MTESALPVIGANGVAIPEGTRGDAGFRTYEVFQRERVGQSTPKIKPAQLVSREFADNPYPLLAVLRENYPCYRDWLNNCFWITRYDDVTSILTDGANYETRSKAWRLGIEGFGRDLRTALPVLTAQANAWDASCRRLAESAIADFARRGEADLATEFAARLNMQLWLAMLDPPAESAPQVAALLWRLHRGVSWDPHARWLGAAAADELVAELAPLLEARRQAPGGDLISAVAGLELEGGPAQPQDLVATLLEMDFDTLHGALANLWLALLTNAEEFDKVRGDSRCVKLAVLEAFRHSTPMIAAQRFARHEVERFGRLIPKGGLLVCSVAAANRDPRVFANPDRFIAGRKDICHREARGQYRADGLATGITPGLGPPTKHPAVPEDRPRSLYALTRDAVITASGALLEAVDDMVLADEAKPPSAICRRLGEMHACWHLPVRFRPR